MVQMCRELSLSFEDTKDHVIQDLELREMALFALSKCHANEDELLKDLMNWERMNLRRQRVRGYDIKQDNKSSSVNNKSADKCKDAGDPTKYVVP